MDRPSPELVNCPHCGAINPAIEDSCRTCEQSLTIFIGPRPKVRTFRLADGMGLIAASAICLAIIRAEPMAGLGLTSLLLPAMIRTRLNVVEREMDTRPMRSGEIAAVFVYSLFIMFAIEGCAGLAFLFIMAFSAPLMGRGWIPPGLGESVAICAGLGVGIVTAWKLWPRKD